MTRAPTHNDFEKRHFEDFAVGDTWEFGRIEVTKEQILSFGRQYDPEPFHRDEELAKESIMGGLIASGIQTASWFRLMQNRAMKNIAFSLSPGWGNIRFHAAVRPGDVLSARAEVLATRESASRPGYGIVEYKGEIFDATGERKFSCEPVALHTRRPAAGEAGA